MELISMEEILKEEKLKKFEFSKNQTRRLETLSYH